MLFSFATMQPNSALAFIPLLLLFVLTESRTAVGGNEASVRRKRQLLGGERDLDLKNPLYTDLATESLTLYVRDKGLTESHEVVEVTKATTQVVAGKLTHIYFNALIGSSNVYTCHSKILEQAWLNVRNITVTCDIKEEREDEAPIVGGQAEQDINDPIYYQLAEESFAKYQENVGATEDHLPLKIKSVTSQVVAGTLTRIVFEVTPVATNEVLVCCSEILEQAWLNRKEIKVNCAPASEGVIPNI